MNILLIRHAHSLVNEDYTLVQKIPDREIDLSVRGFVQAREMGMQLTRFCAMQAHEINSIRFLVSTYRRAIQTADTMLQNFESPYHVTYQKTPLICEKGMGKFEGHDLDAIVSVFGEEAKNFLTEYNDYGRKYNARPPNRVKGDAVNHDHIGESYKDCDVRAAQFMANEILCHPYQTDMLDVIVGHGRMNTFLERQFLGLDESHYLSIPIYNNGAFKLFHRREEGVPFEDKGLVFHGFENPNERAMESLFPIGQTPQ